MMRNPQPEGSVGEPNPSHTPRDDQDPAVEFAEADSRVEAALLSGDPARREAALERLDAATVALSQARRDQARKPSWDALLADPTQQLDQEGIVLRSVLAHQCSHANRTTSPPATAGGTAVTVCPDCGLYL